MSTLLRNILLNKNLLQTYLKATYYTSASYVEHASILIKPKPKPFANIKDIILRNNYSTFNRFNQDYRDRRPTQRLFRPIEDYVPIEDDLSFSPKSHTNADKNAYTSDCEFSSFDIPKPLLARLKELGYNNPFPIQEKTLEYTLKGSDLIGKAITGSGKTLAFAIPIISKILKSPNRGSRLPKALVLSPTRELCMQLKNAIQELDPSLRCVAIYGGTQLNNQIQQLNGHVDIVCATPGRLRDLMQRQNFNPSQIEMVCLDEADELLTPNFFEQIEEVLDAVSDQKQMLLFSATINENVRDLINKYSRSPKVIDLTSGQAHKLPENVKHFIMDAPQAGHADVAQLLIAQYNSERCILFANTKRNAISISTQLNDNGIRSFDLHSDHSQSRREKTFRDFRRGLFRVLVATDVASRGIDIPEVDLVVHSGVPPNGLDYYIHRSGRTGRGGRPGTSILLSTNDRMESSRLQDIKRVVKFTNLPVPQNLIEKFSKMRVDDRYNQTRTYGSNRGYGSNRYEPKSNYQSKRNEPYESRDNDRANRFTPKYRASN